MSSTRSRIALGVLAGTIVGGPVGGAVMLGVGVGTAEVGQTIKASSLGLKPKIPGVSNVASALDPDVREAAKKRAAALKRRRGFASTIITGPLGVTEAPATKKTVLG